MVLKRKRNLKVDPSHVYSVYNLRDINLEEAEDYIEQRDTGMEADEEKEVHLQNIIKGNDKDIPIPVIREVLDSDTLFPKRTTTEEDDSVNRYIKTEEEVEIPEDTVELIKKVGEDKRYAPVDESLALQLLKRTIVRYERSGFENYSCFRNRIFTPTFKARKNEGVMVEKLNRMGVELTTLGVMTGLLKQKLLLEVKSLELTVGGVRELTKLNRSISNRDRSISNRDGISNRGEKELTKLSGNSISKGVRRRLAKKFTRGLMKLKEPINVESMTTNRDKINMFHNRRISTELYLDIKHYSEIMKLINTDVDDEESK